MANAAEKLADKSEKKDVKPGLWQGVSARFSEPGSDLKPYLPADLVGGSIPHVAGHEDEAVWNAAAQSCGTERVHYCYTVDEGRVWYLAAPSAALASAPDTWCPLAAALPGNSEHWDKETVYLYEQEGQAAALRWEPETRRMQVFLGASRTILPRVQTMDANFVTINPEVAQVSGWRNRALLQEKLSRSLARGLFFSGMLVGILALLYWAIAFAVTNIVRPDLSKAQELTRQATEDLMIRATLALKSDTHRHMARIQDLLVATQEMRGKLVRYQVMPDGAVEWEAIVPEAFSLNIGKQLNATVVGPEGQGKLRIRGNN